MSKPQELTIVVAEDGNTKFIYDDRLADLCEEGDAVTQRASHVEPAEGGWTADLSPVNGPLLGPYRLREEALAAEVTWLQENLL